MRWTDVRGDGDCRVHDEEAHVQAHARTRILAYFDLRKTLASDTVLLFDAHQFHFTLKWWIQNQCSTRRGRGVVSIMSHGAGEYVISTLALVTCGF